MWGINQHWGGLLDYRNVIQTRLRKARFMFIPVNRKPEPMLAGLC